MQFKLGKIKTYNGTTGTIITPESQYIFLDKDVSDDIKIGDIVIFRDEYLNGTNRAYFIKKYQKNISYKKN